MGNHLLRCISTTLLILIAVASNAQVFQTNNQPYKFRGLKAADLLIAPKGCDTAALTNPKWGESTAGALFVDTCNNRLYFYNGLKWNQVTGGGGGVDSFYYNFRNLNDTTLLWDRGDGVVDTLAFTSGMNLVGQYVDSVTTVGDSLYYWKGGTSFFSANLALSVVGGDTTNLSTVDSTGQPARRVLISAPGNKITSDRFFLYDTAQRKLVIGSAIIGAGGSVQLYVQGKIATGSNFIGDSASVNYTGLGTKFIRYNSDSMRVYGLVPITDTGRFKPMVYDATNNTWSYRSSWPSGSDTTGLGSLYIRNQFATQENKKFSVIQGKVDALDFNTTSSIADSTQRLTWDDGNGTLNIGLKGGQVNLAVGQEQVARVYNDAGVTLNDGDIVYITGAQGNRIKVQKAVNTDAAIAYATLGMVTETITAGSEGFVTILGTVNHLNTSSFAEGTELYLSGTAGGYTDTKPSYPAAIVSIGRVERSHATVGSIYVNVRPELPTVASYGKNAGGDSTILLLTNGQRFAAKDSVGAGGGSGVTTVGTFSGSSQPNGATISGSTITFGPADATNPGMVSTGAQTWAGAKSFANGIVMPANQVIDWGNAGLGAKIYTWNNGAAQRQGIAHAGSSSPMTFFTNNGYEWRAGGDPSGTVIATLSNAGLFTPSQYGFIDLGLASGAKIWTANNGSAGGRQGIGTTGTEMHYYSNGSMRFYLGGDYNASATNQMRISTSGVEIRELANQQKILPFSNGSKLTWWDVSAGNRAGVGWFNDWRFTQFFGPSNSAFIFSGDGDYVGTGMAQWVNITSGGMRVGATTGYTTADASATLDVSSTTRGFLPPRMTTAQMNAISSPAAGLQIYNSTLSQPHYRDGSTWQAQVGMTFGTAAPTSTPTAVGNFFLDTTNKKLYVATGTASSADWTILN